MESETEMPEKSPANGEAQPVRRASQAQQKLTYKQEMFCKGIAKGLTYSDAYRGAYNAEKMKAASVHRHACLLAANVKVKSRLLALEQEDDRDAVHSAIYRRTFVLEGLAMEAVDMTGTQSAGIRAYELLGKSQGVDLFTDIKEHRHTSRTPEEIETELRKRLSQLFSDEPLPNQGKLIDVTPEEETVCTREPWEDGRS